MLTYSDATAYSKDIAVGVSIYHILNNVTSNYVNNNIMHSCKYIFLIVKKSYLDMSQPHCCRA